MLNLINRQYALAAGSKEQDAKKAICCAGFFPIIMEQY